jgi:hypothetical protein
MNVGLSVTLEVDKLRTKKLDGARRGKKKNGKMEA